MQDSLSMPEEMLQGWLRRVFEAQAIHYECAKMLDRRNLWFGIPSVSISTVVGTSVFASLSDTNPDMELRIFVGLISVLSAVLAGLQTFLRFSERAEKHRAVAAKYGAVRREVEQMLAFRDFDGNDGRYNISSLRAKIDALAEEAPATPERIYKAVALRANANQRMAGAVR